MTQRELDKISNAARRSAAKALGWKQRDYINWRVEQGYFFCLLDLNPARLEVKPLYADDLWWDIFEMPENKSEPMSLRGNGAFSLEGITINNYDEMVVDEATDAEYLEAYWKATIEKAHHDMQQFIHDNPDAEAYIPEIEVDETRDCTIALVRLMALIHNGREDEAVEFIKRVKKKGGRCMYHSGFLVDSDGFGYILDWCRKRKMLGRLERLNPFKKNK